MTDNKTKQQMIQKFLNYGVEPKKIILWNNQGIPEFFNGKDANGVDIVFMEGLQFHIRNKKDEEFFNHIRQFLYMNRQFYRIDSAQYPAVYSYRYQQRFGKPLNWNNLQTWTEKMQWLKIYDNTPLKTRLADKYLVRYWIREKIGEEYLIPLLGVWDNFDDIDFDLLPNQFVLKCNHGSGMNIIVRDKKDFDIENAREKINAWLDIDFGAVFFEPHYNNIPKKIIAEKFMTDGENFDLVDYKFLCFDGRVFCCNLITERSTNERLDYFDLNWNHMDFEQSDFPNSKNPEKIVKPKNFELMKELAAELCKDFIHVRVDFYEVEGKIYFGEMTFTPAGGDIIFNTKDTDKQLGSLMTLPIKVR